MKKYSLVSICLMVVIIMVGCNKTDEEEKVLETFSNTEVENSYTLENENLSLILDPSSTSFQVIDKRSNAVWYSNPVDGNNDPLANGLNKSLLQSTLILKYSNENGVDTLYNNHEYSIERGQYSIEQGNDYIKVNYTLGVVEKVFKIPLAISEDRLNIFLEKMDSSGQRQIKEYYRKYDINNLRASDNKSELLSLYPNLANEIVYAVRDGIPDHLRQKLEVIFSQAGYTDEDFELDSQIGSKAKDKNIPFFNISVIYRLEDKDLVVELPFDEMEWYDYYPMINVKVLPYFGAGSTEDEGYLLIPEGNGSIITFNNGKNTMNSYYSDIYGWDDALKRNALIDESRADFPVFGIAKNGNSVLCILEDYAAVAAIEADVSGRSNSYNYANATYTVIHSAPMNVSAKSAAAVVLYEKNKPQGSVKQRYSFLNSDDYVDMAIEYRQYLLDRYPNMKKKEETSTPVNVTVLGAIDKIKQKFGVPMSVPIALTTYNEAYELLTDLYNLGFKNLSIKYSGWMNGGLKHKNLNRIKPISELGGEKAFRKFIQLSKELNVPVYLEGRMEYAYDNTLFDGFVINRDAAKYATREIVKLKPFSRLWFGVDTLQDYHYLLKPQVALEAIDNLWRSVDSYAASGLAFYDIGHYISGDYNPKNNISRQDVINMQQEKMQELIASGKGIIVNHGNDYVIPYVDFVTNMDFKGNMYHIIDHAIPFYSIALHGLVNYSGKAVNLAENYQDMVLKSVETGAGLSFTFMKEPVSTLQESNYTSFFAADYDQWIGKAYEIYSRYEEELGHCFNQYITDHEILSEKVMVTSYEDGTKVYVNYSNTDFAYNGLNVPARDYIVERR
ncbi:MAG: hypothetical protein GX288_02495 [Clostridiales bacterium]|nr:hypothetical protein [Clostridiales bacterium]